MLRIQGFELFGWFRAVLELDLFRDSGCVGFTYSCFGFGAVMGCFGFGA